MIKNKKIRFLAFIGVIVLAVAVVLGISIAVGNSNNTVKQEISVEDAQRIMDTQLDSLPNSVALCAKYLRENSSLTVTDLDYGTEKNITLSCTYKTLDL